METNELKSECSSLSLPVTPLLNELDLGLKYYEIYDDDLGFDSIDSSSSLENILFRNISSTSLFGSTSTGLDSANEVSPFSSTTSAVSNQYSLYSSSSSSSSLSLSDINTNNFMFYNNIEDNTFKQNSSYSNPNSHMHNNFRNTSESLQFHSNDFVSSGSVSKQDVSVGTELSINRDLRYKKDYDWVDNFRISHPSDNFLSVVRAAQPTVHYLTNLNHNTKVNEKESFKLIEKVQPKKSRTKYSKDQIEVLESAYSKHHYPDLITVEQLCKSIGISREKINIWFQNRRARTKRTVV